MIIFSDKVFGTAVVGIPETIQMQHGKPNCNLFMNASFRNQFNIKNAVKLSLKSSVFEFERLLKIDFWKHWY